MTGSMAIHCFENLRIGQKNGWNLPGQAASALAMNPDEAPRRRPMMKLRTLTLSCNRIEFRL